MMLTRSAYYYCFPIILFSLRPLSLALWLGKKNIIQRFPDIILKDIYYLLKI